MTEYAVTDPATGEQIRTYPTAIRRGHRGGPRRSECGVRGLVAEHDGVRPGRDGPPGR